MKPHLRSNSTAPQQSPQSQSISLSNQTLTFGVAVIPGESYQVQCRPSLAPPVWQNLGSQSNANASTLTFTDSLNQNQRFYRIILLPAP